MPDRRQSARARSTRLRGSAGSTLVEALVALVLTALGAGALAAVASAGGRALVTARRDAAATALAAAALDVARAGPRTGGADTATLPDGTTVARRWTASDGRGAPDRLAVGITWLGHRLDLTTEALP
jgi:Tfp pilus assembly protein PilV